MSKQENNPDPFTFETLTGWNNEGIHKTVIDTVDLKRQKTPDIVKDYSHNIRTIPLSTLFEKTQVKGASFYDV